MLARSVGLFFVALFLASCATTPPYTYRYTPGRTATMENGLAIAPEKAPAIVRRAIWAGNDLVGKPYRYGGGHASFYDSAYDCSGAVGYVLHAVGRLETPTPSNGFRHYAEGGAGKWMTVYAANGHTFLVVTGLRFDTGYGSDGHGPQWLTRGRPADRYVMRHPGGL